MKTIVSACFVLAGLSSGALGQGSAEWVLLAGSGTKDGDFEIVEARGENSCTYVLGIDLTPSPGETLGDGSLVVGFGSVIANVIGTKNWGYRSEVTWTVNPDLIFLTGDLTHRDDATQDLYDINAGQIPGFGPFSSGDPMWIITIKWTTDDLWTDRDVTALLDTQDSDSIQAYVKRPRAEFEEPQTWAAPDGLLAHRVSWIPGPGSLGMMAFVVFGASVRRARGPIQGP